MSETSITEAMPTPETDAAQPTLAKEMSEVKGDLAAMKAQLADLVRLFQSLADAGAIVKQLDSAIALLNQIRGRIG